MRLPCLGLVRRGAKHQFALENRQLVRLIHQPEPLARVGLEIHASLLSRPVIDVGIFGGRRRYIADEVDMYRLGARGSEVNFPFPGLSIGRQGADSQSVGLPRMERIRKREIEPVFFGVVGAVINGVVVFPAVYKPGEIRAFAFAADVRRIPTDLIDRIVTAGQKIVCRLYRLFQIQRLRHHFLVGALLALFVMHNVAVLKVDHQDPIGQRQYLDNLRSGCPSGSCHTEQRNQDAVPCKQAIPFPHDAPPDGHSGYVSIDQIPPG